MQLLVVSCLEEQLLRLSELLADFRREIVCVRDCFLSFLRHAGNLPFAARLGLDSEQRVLKTAFERARCLHAMPGRCIRGRPARSDSLISILALELFLVHLRFLTNYVAHGFKLFDERAEFAGGRVQFFLFAAVLSLEQAILKAHLLSLEEVCVTGWLAVIYF